MSTPISLDSRNEPAVALDVQNRGQARPAHFSFVPANGVIMRLPPRAHDVFTPNQLEALYRLTLVKRLHLVDLKWTGCLWRRRCFAVFWLGMDRRGGVRQRQEPDSGAAGDGLWFARHEPVRHCLEAGANPQLSALLSQLPQDVRDSLTVAQLYELETATGARDAKHGLDLRRTFNLFGRRAYMALIAGGERRGETEGDEPSKKKPIEGTFSYAFLLALISAGLTFFVITVLYCAKSVMGINLFEERSILHELLFPE